LNGLSLIFIDACERSWLGRDFEESEVWEVMRDLNGDKTPDPNRFSMAFFQKCWEVLKEDIMEVFKEFYC
jgi:hypothetical protein